ncbi:MAG: hypothetical protein ACMG6E_03230 [Candidatus Roizmanbacteria bacterium]
MKKKQNHKIKSLVVIGLLLLAVTIATGVNASHSWGTYHWARNSNPFTLILGDNLTSSWDSYLVTTSSDWSISSVLETTIAPGLSNPRRCQPSSGRVEVCNSKYGNNGWLGIAQIWASGGHITQGVTKLNDTYFNTTKYNTPAWKNLVMCQEVGHVFGLDHQDENFGNLNLGTCMDYTNNPSDSPSNEHPNAHDYEELETIYAHLDNTTTVGQSKAGIAQQEIGNIAKELGDNPADWGRKIRDNGKVAIFEKDQGNNQKVVTFVIWANLN